MEILISLGIFVAICAALLGFVFLVNYLKAKFNIKDSEIELGKKIIELIVYVAQKGNIKYAGNISEIAQIVIDAVDFVNVFNQGVDNQEKKQLIEDEALQICKERGIPEDETLISLISDIADYFIK